MKTKETHLTGLEYLLLIRMGKAFKFFLGFFERSNLITFLIFKIPVKKKAKKVNWDITTLVIKKCIDKHIRNNGKELRVLEMGCGDVAILAQYIKSNYKSCNVTGVDIYQDFVKNARLNVKRNGLDVKILKSDLYQNIKNKYDYIIFNPPYVPNIKENGDKVKYKKVRFSGKEGVDITRRFLLESNKYLKKGGKLLLGINCFYIPLNKIKDIIEEHGYRIEDIVTRRFNTSNVFLLSYT